MIAPVSMDADVAIRRASQISTCADLYSKNFDHKAKQS